MFIRSRLDAESFDKAAIRKIDLLQRKDHVSLISICDVSDGNHMSIAADFEDSTNGVRYLRGQDINSNMVLDDRNRVYISESDYRQLSRSHIFKNDVLITIVGANTGQTAWVDVAPKMLTGNCKLGIIRPRKSAIDSRFLHAFIASSYGQIQVISAKRGGGQMGLILPDLRNLKIARFSPDFEQSISQISSTSHQMRRRAKDTLSKGEIVLASSLGLTNWTPKPALSYVRNSTDVFSSGRLDAEHFQDEYVDLNHKLRQYPLGFRALGKLASSFTNGAEIREYVDHGVPYLRVGDLQDLDINPESVVHVSPSLAEEVIDKVRLTPGDVLVSRSGSLAVTAVVEDAWKDALISSHLIRVPIADSAFDPYYVAMFLRSMPGKMQIKQWSNGGVQPEINQPSLAQVVVPQLDWDAQMRIRTSIFEARRQKQAASALLRAAIRAVEIAIEDSETAAMDYLQSVTEEHG